MQTSFTSADDARNAGIALARNKAWNEALRAFAAAFRINRNDIRHALYAGAALWESGRETEAVHLWSLGADFNPLLRAAAFQPGMDPFTRDCSRLANTELCRALTKDQNNAVAALGVDPGRIATAVWPQTHDSQISFKDGDPRPYVFYAPDLPPTPIFEREDVSWTKEFERHTDAIRDEFLSLVSRGVTGEPYIPAGSKPPEWSKLSGQMTWESLHIFKDAKPTNITDRAPVTCAAIENIPAVRHGEHPMEVFFSVLKAGAHIPPHFGLANCRTTVHLPLIIPEDCAIRVGETVHSWTEGETFIFDDSFNHEAWNKSGNTRVVLIFEAWRPDMTAGEIQAVEASYAARQTWMHSRRMPKELEG